MPDTLTPHIRRPHRAPASRTGGPGMDASGQPTLTGPLWNASLTRSGRTFYFRYALNTISATVYDDPAAADDLIGRLGELLRRSLRTSDRQEIPLAEELEVLRAYQALIEARFGDRVCFALDVADDARALAVPAFLLQPLVENAVHHGASLEYQSNTILVTAMVDRGVLRLIVENDAPEAERTPARVGTGLGATRDRLRLLYGQAALLETDAVAGRFRVTVGIPAHVVPPSAPLQNAALPQLSSARAHR